MRHVSLALQAFILWLVPFLPASDQTFILETHSLTPYTRTYLGNGQIGVSSSALGTQPTECFMAGVYDHATGDVPRIAVLPAWNGINVYNGLSWLNSAPTVQDYSQTLDMYDALLRTRYEWADGERVTEVALATFVSRADPAIGALRIEITPRYSGRIKISFSLKAWPEPKRYPLEKLERLTGEAALDQWAIWYPGHMVPVASHAGREALSMVSQAEGSSVRVAEEVTLVMPPELEREEVRTRESDGEAEAEVSFDARPGRQYTFYKIATIHRPDSRAAATPQSSWDALLERHVRASHAIWESDILTEGDDALQRVVHSMMFYLLGSAGSAFSIPPMGLATAGYYGHIFWDADTYMFPALLLLHPNMAKEIVMFRARTLRAAQENARRNGYKGAMYPWEAGPDGSETTPRFASQNALFENHVNGDVALAEWQYYLATGDRAWLEQYGYPVIRETADFWASRVQYDREKDRYEIGNVVSVKESLIGISNDPYTNAVARKNLELAITASTLLNEPVNPRWREISAKMYLPGGDLLLIDYPLEFPVTAAEKRAVAETALARPPEGAMMGVEFLPILAEEFQDRTLLDALMPRTYLPYIRTPFNVLPETPTNNNINFITGAGAFLQQFLFGYTGLRLSEEGLTQKYTPMLPSRVKRLVLRNVTVRGRRKDIEVQK